VIFSKSDPTKVERAVTPASASSSSNLLQRLSDICSPHGKLLFLGGRLHSAKSGHGEKLILLGFSEQNLRIFSVYSLSAGRIMRGS